MPAPLPDDLASALAELGERAFRTMKDPARVSFAPLHHWTDQKIRVHVSYCVLALTLVSLLVCEASRVGIQTSVVELLEDLAQIREVTSVFAPAPRRRKRTTATALSQMSARQRALFDALGLAQIAAQVTRSHAQKTNDFKLLSVVVDVSRKVGLSRLGAVRQPRAGRRIDERRPGAH